MCFDLGFVEASRERILFVTTGKWWLRGNMDVQRRFQVSRGRRRLTILDLRVVLLMWFTWVLMFFVCFFFFFLMGWDEGFFTKVKVWLDTVEVEFLSLFGRV